MRRSASAETCREVSVRAAAKITLHANVARNGTSAESSITRGPLCVVGPRVLVSWFRNSLHHRRESLKRISEPNDTRILGLPVSFDSEVRIRGRCRVLRTSESGHWCVPSGEEAGYLNKSCRKGKAKGLATMRLAAMLIGKNEFRFRRQP